MSALSSAQLRVICASIVLVTLVGIGLSLSMPLLSLRAEAMGISALWNGLNVAVAGVATMVTVPLVPRVAARIGVRRLVFLAVMASLLAILAFALEPPFPLWFPLRFVLGAALGALFVLSEFWINSSAPPDRRGLVMGIYATLLAVGFAAGPLILTATSTAGFAPFGVAALLFAFALVPLALAGGAAPELERAPRNSTLSFLRAAPAATLAAFVFGAVETAIFAHLPVFGVRSGFTEATAALLVSAVALGNVLFQVPIGALSDRMDRRLLLVACALAAAASAALVPLMGVALYPVMAVLFLFGGIFGALYTVGLAHLGARFQGEDLAAANAAFVLLYSVGFVAGSPLAGAALDLFGPPGFPLSLAAMLGLYALVVLVRMAGSRAGRTA